MAENDPKQPTESNGQDENEKEAKKKKDPPEETKAIPSVLPVLPVRDVVIFNYMILPLFISRQRSVQAVEQALQQSRHVMVLAQKEENTEDPNPEDLYTIGTVANVMRVLKLPDSRIKLLIQGVCRARVTKFDNEGHFMTAEIETIDEEPVPHTNEIEAELRQAREQSEKVLSLRGVVSPDIGSILQSVEDPGRLADLIAANIRMKTSEAQELLETIDPVKRLSLVNIKLAHEMEIATVQAKIQNTAREGMDKAQKDFFLREQLKAIRQELGEKDYDSEDELNKLKESIENCGMPKEVKEEAEKELHRLKNMHPEAAESSVIHTYLEWLIALPWKKLSRDNLNIKQAEEVLNEDHCGLEKVKDRILEFLSVRKLNPQSKGSILCLVGPPGVGKTSLGRSIARALNRKFERISLGGMHDEAEIRGHRRTYIGAMPGRIISSIKKAGTRNPVIMLDEVDKIGADFRGDPASALLEALDPEQNFSFSDHYLNVPFNLSKVLFLCTANQTDPIPAALKDRMEIITISGYTAQEKLAIAKEHLIAKQIKENGLEKDDVNLTHQALEKIIQEYTREAGVRGLERELASLLRKLARKKAQGEAGPFKINVKEVEKLLGVPRYVEDKKLKELPCGVAQGLAWTAAGGVVLNVEATLMKGKGEILLTGKLGDVMKESAQAAVSYIRTHAADFGADPEFSSKHDLHIHVPEGATPKDGPSAGVTLTSALLSAVTKAILRADTCMTGEITLLGRVLPVGGIKEKILAGVTRGLKHVIIPAENKKDLEEVPPDLLKKITVHTVSSYDEIIPLAFDNPKALYAKD